MLFDHRQISFVIDLDVIDAFIDLSLPPTSSHFPKHIFLSALRKWLPTDGRGMISRDRVRVSAPPAKKRTLMNLVIMPR